MFYITSRVVALTNTPCVLIVLFGAKPMDVNPEYNMLLAVVLRRLYYM